jgi:excisionase family DNA binding protein
MKTPERDALRTLRNRSSGPTHTSGEPVVISVAQAALLAGVSRQSAYEAARRGEIPTVRIGRRILVPRVKLLRILNGES